MERYTLDDLMVVAGIEEGEPRQATLVGSDAPPCLPGMAVYAEEGDEFDLVYDDGRDNVTVRVQV